jgi:DNA-binding NtrC family response regulator
MMQQPWHGNVRDLENAVEAAAVLSPGPIIDVAELQIATGPSEDETAASALPEPYDGFSMPDYMRQVRETLVNRALKASAGNQSRAARLLGISPQALSKFLATDSASVE